MASAFTIVSQGLGSSAYTASSSWYGAPPGLAFDGDFSTTWNAADYPVEWLEVNLGQPTDIVKLQLSVAQSPVGITTHQLWLSSSSIQGNTDYATLAHTFSGQTSDGQLLSIDLAVPVVAQYIQIRTVESPSWVAWKEVQVMTADPVPEPSTILLFGTGIAGWAGTKLRRIRHWST